MGRLRAPRARGGETTTRAGGMRRRARRTAMRRVSRTGRWMMSRAKRRRAPGPSGRGSGWLLPSRAGIACRLGARPACLAPLRPGQPVGKPARRDRHPLPREPRRSRPLHLTPRSGPELRRTLDRPTSHPWRCRLSGCLTTRSPGVRSGRALTGNGLRRRARDRAGYRSGRRRCDGRRRVRRRPGLVAGRGQLMDARGEVARRHRAAEIVALQLVAAEGAQPRDLLGRLHAFGQRR